MSASIVSRVADEFGGTDRYAVVRRIGAGGMGVVYHTVDRERGVDVALKTLRHLNPGAIYHLKQEFRSLADLAHPNLVTLHDLVIGDGLWFFTMELIDGKDFVAYARSSHAAPAVETMDAEVAPSAPPSAPRDALAAGSRVQLSSRLDVARLRNALRQLVEGIATLHRASKLHRDIKPSNVMVEPSGRVVILDFGLAADFAAMDDRDRSAMDLNSAEQTVLGTPEYMSPEQGNASPVPLGPATDWYSVGVMLFEALTGGLPFQGGPLEILMAKCEADGPAPSEFVDGVPEDLDRLCADLLQRRPDKRPTGEEIARRIESTSVPMPVSQRSLPAPPSQRSGAPLPLVGREMHTAMLQAAFARTRQGRAIAVHVYGSAGLGKSSLVRNFIDWAVESQRAVALVGRCYERESVPYKALDGVIDALSRHLRRMSRLQVEAVLPRDVRALSRLFPVLLRVESIAKAPKLALEQADPKELRKRAFAALRELLARVADRRPLVVAIDDLQWGDVDSMTCLVEVLRPPSPPAVLFIASYRREDVDKSPALRALEALENHGGSKASMARITVAPAIVDLRRSTSSLRRVRVDTACEVRRLAIERLGNDDSAALVKTLLDAESPTVRAHAATIVAEAGGSPFLTLEFVRYLRGLEERGEGLDGKAITIEAAISARFDALPDDARRLLEAVAVAGHPIAVDVARKSAGVSDERPALALLRTQQLVRTLQVGELATTALETYHDRIREAVVARLTPTTLVTMHRALARTLEASGNEDPEAICTHYRAAGDDLKASAFAALAGARAARTLAFERAAMLYRLAIELGDAKDPATRGHRIKLADALVDCGRSAEAAHEYLAAAAGATGDEALDLQRRAAEQMLVSGHIDEGLSVVPAVLEALGADLPETPRGALSSLLLRRFQLWMRGLEPSKPKATVDPRELLRIDTYWSLGIGLSMVDNIRAQDCHTRHLLYALRSGDPYRVARGVAAEAGFRSSVGGPARAKTRALVLRAQELAEKVGHPHALGLAAGAAGHESYHLGEWHVARERLENAEKILRERCAGVGWELASVVTFLLGALYYLGDVRALGDRVPALIDEAERRGDLFLLTNLRLGHASFLWLADDDPDGGLRDVKSALDGWSQRGYHVQHYYELAARAQILLYAGKAKKALEALDAAWPALEASFMLRLQRVRIEAFVLRARTALSCASLCEGAEREALIARARKDLTRVEREHMPWGDALVRLARAGIFGLQGHAETQARELEVAADLLQKCNMHLHAAAAHHRFGELVGGDDGKSTRKEADAYFATEGIVDPERVTLLLVSA